MNPQIKMLCITGADGTGKSTIIELLAQEMPSVYKATIWDLLFSKNRGLPFQSKKEVDDFLCGLTPDARFLFLAHAMKYAIDKAMDTDKAIILMDSYYYKYMATELALGTNRKLVKQVIEVFPKPDWIFELTLPLDEVIQRKQQFSRYECGLAETTSKEAFIHFQDLVNKEWAAIDWGHHHYRLDASNTPEALADSILKTIHAA